MVLKYCEELWKGKGLNQTESLWLGVVLAKVAPDKYKLELKKITSNTHCNGARDPTLQSSATVQSAPVEYDVRQSPFEVMSNKGKYDSCEHCERLISEGKLLFTVECWVTTSFDGRQRPSYWLTCEHCYETRHQWCERVFPDNCEICGAVIDYSEHHLEKELNQRGQLISSGGLSSNETCRIVCKNCTPQK